MDRKYRQAFQTAAAKCKPKDLRRFGLWIDEFLDTVSDQAEVPEIATAALNYFCVDSHGNFNNYVDGLFAVLSFVEIATGQTVFEKQLIADLRVMLTSGSADGFSKYLEQFLDAR